MSTRNLQVGIAVAVALGVAALFFVSGVSLNPFAAPAPATPELLVQDEVVGTGVAAAPGDTLVVNYTGQLPDGTIFDTSVNRGPYEFVLGAGNVIPGWDQGLVGMREGGKRLLLIPPEYAYGYEDYQNIPGGSSLLFEVELLKVARPSGVPVVPVIQ